MTTVHDHVDFETLSDFADECLAAPERTRVQAHLAICDVCATRLARLRQLLGSASSLPESLEPPRDLWRAIQSRIGSAPRALPSAIAPVEPSRGTRFTRRGPHPWMLAAAALFLVIVSSAVTAFLVRRPTVVISSATPPAASAPMLPAAARVVDADYARTIAELTEALAAHRTALDPATVAKVEASLRVIDEAIDEARRALARDPANLTLLDLLSANYERKLELLRRASELPAST